MSSHDLIEVLTSGLSQIPQGALLVGFSGGMDSSALLHAFAQIPLARTRGLRALHIDHGLHESSSDWAEHCCAYASALNVPIDVENVTVVRDAGTGLEDAARTARYAAFARHLRHDEVLTLAHHRDDQAETVLLKLLRGAGPEGLGAMRRLRRAGDGYLWRPLLDLPRTVLLDYAQHHGLRWIDDPSNADPDLRRNYLRREIMPRLKMRWPHADAALAHSAEWLRAAADFIGEHAIRTLEKIRGDNPSTLRWQPWLELPDALRDPVLRAWLRTLGLDEPSHFHRVELERQLRTAADDRNPCVRWDGTEVRRYRDLIFAMRPLRDFEREWETDWHGEPLQLPGGGRLSLAPRGAKEISLRVRYRRGGETLVPADGKHHRELRLLLQERGVPPWERERIPLILADGELLGVGGEILSEKGRAWCSANGVHFVWEPD